MTNKQKECINILNSLARDNVLSSMQIALSMIDCAVQLFQYEKLGSLIENIINNQPSMAVVINVGLDILDALEEGSEKQIKSIKNSIISSSEQSVCDASDYLAGIENIATISYSKSVFDVIKSINPKSVYLSVAHPAKEGELFAEKLKQLDIKPILIEDSAYSLILKNVEAVIVGADAVFENSFVNKTGTFALALMSKEFKVPFYVVSCSCKLLDNNRKKYFKILPRPQDEVSDCECERINFYFEEVSNKLANKMFVR